MEALSKRVTTESTGLVEAAVLALDCAEPEALAEFYARLLGAELSTECGGPERIEITGRGGTRMAFRRDHGAAPNSWPRPDDSQQAHLELLVARVDMDAVERQVIALGGRPLDTKDNEGPRDSRLYSDPAGHTFSLLSQ
ncbi:extradiol dioxygenase [Streptomyces sp. ERV7]|uniref:VOC family protein n=1 Tax=Streptomyces sp. ERV7 TaxID=1322334 RepID=UPI0007F53EE4|nr:VOC family protein [Streptomyces sp. ERV7]OAR26914.1 extradiol dioxygenase [Streptomyces sp. ERV7]